jgi:hypothetical protein
VHVLEIMDRGKRITHMHLLAWYLKYLCTLVLTFRYLPHFSLY